MRYDCIQDEFSSCESGQQDAPIGQPQRSESGTGPDRAGRAGRDGVRFRYAAGGNLGKNSKTRLESANECAKRRLASFVPRMKTR